MWKPVSKLDYLPLNPQAQVLVVACPLSKRDAEISARWKDRAVAIAGDSERYLRDVVRDLLANPQVRIIVFDGEACGREAYAAFWAGAPKPEWRIDQEHLALVRQFVDLYDDDCSIKAPMQPFWPARTLYLDEIKEETPCG